MTATILLIRHAAHAEVGAVLSGRRPGLALSPRGREQAERLARRLAGWRIDAVQTSPVERARQTAEAIGGTIADVAALDEVDFGDWAGMRFAALEPDPLWHRWNTARAVAEAPGGETMRAVQDRVWAHCEQAARAGAGRTLAMVSHCDVIRAAIARALDLSLDRILSFDVAPASISCLELGDWGARVVSVNDTAHLEDQAA